MPKNSASPWRSQQRDFASHPIFPKGSKVQFDLFVCSPPITVIGRVLGSRNGRIRVFVSGNRLPPEIKTREFAIDPSVLRLCDPVRVTVYQPARRRA